MDEPFFAQNKSESGFTIIEVMVAITLLLIGVLGVATMADNANIISTTTKARVGAVNLAREMLEDARTFKYEELTGTVPAGGVTTLQTAYSNIGITDNAPSTTGFQVVRRGTTYTVNIFTCVLDDAHDGVRAAPSGGSPDENAAGPYCLGSPVAGSAAKVDKNPDDQRKVEVSVSWTFRGANPQCSGAGQTNTSGPLAGLGRACVTQSELIADPAGGLGPAIKTLVQATPGTVESGTDVPFNVTTVSTAQTVTWLADDGSAGTAAAKAGNTDGTQWTFNYGPLGTNSPSDGTHIVTAQAFLLGAGGVPKQVSVSLNRFIPGVPLTSGGGVDTRISSQHAAALTWQQNSDNDIIGYTVYRANSPLLGPVQTGSIPPPDTPVCSTTSVSATSCFDASNNLASFASTAAICPAGSALTDACIDYYVVPFDQKWALNPNNTYTNAECPGTPWGSVTVPAPPVPASRSVAPLTASASWPNARMGCPSGFIAINYTTGSSNQPPAPPTTPSCTTDTGQPVINWVEPTSPDGDGDAIVSYRIYRDPPSTPPPYNSSATTINYGVPSFKDPNPTGGIGHDYYVTAVDARFQESSELHIAWSAGACP